MYISVPKPVGFFRIKGSQAESNTFSLTTTKVTTISPTTDTVNIRRLAEEATALLGLDEADSFAVKNCDDLGTQGFSRESATDTMCGFFAAFATKVKTDVEVPDRRGNVANQRNAHRRAIGWQQHAHT